MAGPVEIIQLEAHDDFVSVRDRCAFVRARRVLLVWPREGKVLQRKLDLVLLQRAVRRQSARLALVTQDALVAQHARELDISAFATIKESQRGRWKRGRSKVFVDRADRPVGEPAPADLRESATRLRAAPAGFWFGLRRLLTALILLAVFGGVAAAGFVLLPSATVTLVPASDHLDVTIRVIADPAAPGIDLEQSVVPATPLQVEIEQSATVDTTGFEEGEPTLATGTVVFTNLTNQPATIPAGTTVNTSAGTSVRFRTLAPVNITGQTDAIAVVAVEALPEYAGAAGNVGAYAINFVDGPLNDILSVQNIDPITGGGQTSHQVVAAGDYERLLATARQAIQQGALTELTPLLGDGQSIIPETIHIAEERPDWTLYSAPVGAEADSVSLTMRAVVQAVVVDDRLVNQAAFAGLTRRIPPGQIVAPERLTFTRGAIELVEESGRVTFLANVTGSVTTRLDPAQIRQALAGLSRADALAYLSQNVPLTPGTTPAIALWPEGSDQLPILADRISVVVRDAP